MTELQEGAVLDDLRIDGVLGQGGMGVVYRAFDMRLERPVALKVIADAHAANPTFRRLFLREARTAAGLDHPHVVTVHRYDERGDLVFLVTQLIEGTDLKALVAASGRLDPALAATLIEQIGSALDAAHERGLVHRDVKPANVLVGGLPRRPHAYLSDFGLTRAISSSTTSGQHTSTAMWGTPAYMAPELFDGRAAGVASDVYALGRTLYEALAGALPRLTAAIGETGATLVAVLPDAELARALDEVVRRATADEPGERFRSAGALAAAAAGAVRSRRGGGARPPVVANVPAPTRAPRTVGPTYVPPSPRPMSVSPDPTLVSPTDGPVAVPRRAMPEHAPPLGPRYVAPEAEPPAVADPRPSPRRSRRWTVAGVAVAGAAAVGAVVFALVPDRLGSTGGSPTAPTTVTLAPVDDHDSTVTLTWVGPTDLDYAVEVAPRGQDASTLLAGRVDALTVAVTPGLPYCFRITATDASRVLSSNTQPVRGARC